jgi:hypothetical protein
MANTVFRYDRNVDSMRQKVRALQMLREAIDVLTRERAVEIQRRGDTNGSQDTHYAALATAGTFLAGDFETANAAARGSFEAIDDLWFKLTTNAEVTDVSNAILNTCAKFGV